MSAILDTCCAVLLRAPLNGHDAEQLATAFKALADPARLRLLSLLASCAQGEACTCDLTEPLGLSQATVSHHLKVLLDAGLVTRDQRGRYAWYRVVAERLEALRGTLAPV